MTATVLVTGGSGKLGRFVVDRLRTVGWQVISADRIRHPDPTLTQFQIDLRNPGEVLDAISGVNERVSRLDAIVHLAAIPAPGLLADLATIDNNLNSSLNVLTAAKNAGIKKLVMASSETVLGLPFDTPPPYLPLDEEYQPRPESYYALGKYLEEKAAEQFCRWDQSLSIIALRFSNVIDPAEYPSFEQFQNDPHNRKWNLWAYIDGRDGALAVQRALEYGVPGFESFIIASPDSVMRTKNSILIDTVFPEVPKTRAIADHETLLGIEKARRLLGFDPQHSWRAGKSPE